LCIVVADIAATIQISGSDAESNPSASWGTGLILDHAHIVTIKHVVSALAAGSNRSVHPSSSHADAEHVNCACIAHPHPHLDVAVIETQMPAGKGLPRLVAFRDPAWADEVYVFGYPRVPMIAGRAITVQRGEVVNPAAETPATADHGSGPVNGVPSPSTEWSATSGFST
jgi:Trypsin-like peptidase domain